MGLPWSMSSRRNCRTLPCLSASGWAEHPRPLPQPRSLPMSDAPLYRRQALSLLGAAALGLAPAARADSDTPLKLWIPFPPGGGTDPAAPFRHPPLPEKLGRPVGIEN